MLLFAWIKKSIFNFCCCFELCPELFRDIKEKGPYRLCRLAVSTFSPISSFSACVCVCMFCGQSMYFYTHTHTQSLVTFVARIHLFFGWVGEGLGGRGSSSKFLLPPQNLFEELIRLLWLLRYVLIWPWQTIAVHRIGINYQHTFAEMCLYSGADWLIYHSEGVKVTYVNELSLPVPSKSHCIRWPMACGRHWMLPLMQGGSCLLEFWL